MPGRSHHPAVDKDLKACLSHLGFDALGQVRLPLDPGHVEDTMGKIQTWLHHGNHGDMTFLVRNAPLRLDPEKVLPGAQSVIVVLSNYHQGQGSTMELSPGGGRVASYAWGRDYHKAFLKQLKAAGQAIQARWPQAQVKVFTDADPLHERFFAVEAGLGFTGRHTLLINSAWGSKVFIGLILSTQALAPVPSLPLSSHGACPSSCRKCIDRCPTGAIDPRGFIDGRKCISYLTIEYQGIIPLEQARLLGDWFYGCDICQDVCPFQIRCHQSTTEAWLHGGPGLTVNLKTVIGLRTHDDVVGLFAGTALMRAGRRGLVRNALVVIGNMNHYGLIEEVRELSFDDDPVVAGQAALTLEELFAKNPGA